MYTILAPSKTFELSSAAHRPVAMSEPQFFSYASQLHGRLQQLPASELQAMMRLSDAKLQEVQRYLREWDDVQRPAVYMYRGDVYRGFYAETLSAEALAWAQQHVGILSGLYGLLRPLDAMSAYRLEMGLKLPINSHANLYDFWGSLVADVVDERADGVVCILSSQEYAKVVTKRCASTVVTPVFMDHKPNGTVGQVPIYSKMMRGVMARWIIDKQVNTADELRGFSEFGYHYDQARSQPGRPVFVRSVMKPLVF